jgi:hypothetical protein
LTPSFLPCFDLESHCFHLAAVFELLPTAGRLITEAKTERIKPEHSVIDSECKANLLASGVINCGF